MTWTFKLRDGVTFHDGEPLTADAVKQSIEAAKDQGRRVVHLGAARHRRRPSIR